MTIDSATAVELVNFAAGVLLLAVAIYAQKKFRFAIFKLGWGIIGVSGAIGVIGIYMLAVAGLKLWGEKGGSEYRRT